jgi:threonylcarbamoyladenosine tRNA methylthiotransferase MtaB
VRRLTIGCPTSRFFCEKWDFPYIKPRHSSRSQPLSKCYDNSVPTYHVENFGCRATQADGAALERQFESRGLASAEASQADLVVLNTCTVTHSADQDARAAIRRLQRQNPQAKIIVTGCYAQRAPQEIAALPGVTAVIGNSHKHRLAELALHSTPRETTRAGHQHDREGHDFSRAVITPSHAALAAEATHETLIPATALTDHWPPSRNQIFVSDIFAHTELLAAPVFESASASTADRTRPNLKVQDGCNNRCSFCVIPNVRGQSRSLPQQQVIDEVHGLVAAGYKELVISGINLGRWGRDLVWGGRSRPPKLTMNTAAQPFVHLLRTILAETTIEKLRISSVEPMDWTDDLINLVARSPRIARHAHVPLQSASDAVLRRMHRKYRPWHYREKIEKIRAAMPTAAIGADVMVGFPGETAPEFESTRRMIDDLPFTYLHVFTYSARPGTPAAAMPDQVPVHIARERNKILRDLAAEKKQAFMRTFVGKTIEAITLRGSEANQCGTGTPAREALTECLTDNYQKLFLSGHYQANRWMTTQIEGISDGAFFGSPLISR